VPYREVERPVRARFELRTPPGFHAVAVTVFAAAAAVVALLLFAGIAHGAPRPFVLFAAVALPLLAAVWWSSSAAYRIGGGKGTLVVYDDVIEVPGVRRGSIVRLPRATLGFERVPVNAQLHFGLVPLATFRRGEILTLRSGDAKRVLSSPDFADELFELVSPVDPAVMESLFDQVFQREAGAKAAGDAELDRRIDDEIAGLDDDPRR
jgi:hypothetical protein